MAVLFDIVRNSYVDGPGVRTTVFFKGCNLRCAWCHNPESQRKEPELLLYPRKCIGCGTCSSVCPTEGIRDPELCIRCGDCALYCPQDARRLCGRDYSVEEVLEQVEKDRRFYENTGGGITCSGGECMLQTDFLTELLRRCREAKLHTCVDTAGCVPFSAFEAVLPYTDLFLYDVKAISPDLHRAYTGADNALILDNLRRLSSLSARIWVRVPVIGGVNDTAEEMQRIAAFCGEIRPEKVELLPYHHLGDGKYEALGRDYKPFSVPDEKKMQEYRALFDRR